MTKQIEIEKVLPDTGSELKNLMKDVLRQQKKEEAKPEEKASSKKENSTKKEDKSYEDIEKNLETAYDKEERSPEKIVAHESVENKERQEDKIPTTNKVNVSIDTQTNKQSIYVPKDATATSNNNRIKEANMPLKTMLTAK
jgi:hypothetical protein